MLSINEDIEPVLKYEMYYCNYIVEYANKELFYLIRVSMIDPNPKNNFIIRELTIEYLNGLEDDIKNIVVSKIENFCGTSIEKLTYGKVKL